LAQRPEVRIQEADLSGQIETETIEVGPEGEFEIELCEGVMYGAWAFLQERTTLQNSAPIRFVPRGKRFEIELRIDRTSGNL
jgi:hypothetical protein